jgi:hypothetical protein
MFGDAYLDIVRNALSNDRGEWFLASLVIAVFVTKLISIAGLSLEFRQQLQCCVAIFLMLAGLFYLP